MKREEMKKLILDSQNVLDEFEFLILGSQAILGSELYDEIVEKNKEKKENYLFISSELDIVPINYPYEEALILEGVFGEESYYHQTHKVYCQIVEEKTCFLINNYQYRLNKINFFADNKLCYAYFLDEEALFIAKILVGREKDFIFCKEMIKQGFVKEESLIPLFEKNKNYLLKKYSDRITEQHINETFIKIKRMFNENKIEKVIDNKVEINSEKLGLKNE